MALKWGHVYGARQKFLNSKKTKGEKKTAGVRKGGCDILMGNVIFLSLQRLIFSLQVTNYYYIFLLIPFYRLKV